ATRFEGKLLAPILNKPMILWTLDGARESERLDEIIVATDSELILKTVTDAGFKAVMTRDDHQSGTDRIWEVAENQDCTHVLNIQGDEPLLNGKTVDQLISALDTKPDSKMVTMVTSLNPDEARDPNRVKVVIDENNRALYFSRSLIPYPREISPDHSYLLHIGLYLYEKQFLREFIGHGLSDLEKIEKLEQLRALAMGVSIDIVHTTEKLMGVDAPDDILQVESWLNRHQSA
ncbi:3-deoxy-manno-octulosonate cytidylyltransferase, partial [bacterium]|nr:3-deoxy-manno-octulosonate cytidylyltransferase [bacterium]MBU1025713.1 3-deoxy-manno-octulosonate cytidylyltransferase [bacterium]